MNEYSGDALALNMSRIEIVSQTSSDTNQVIQNTKKRPVQPTIATMSNNLIEQSVSVQKTFAPRHYSAINRGAISKSNDNFYNLTNPNHLASDYKKTDEMFNSNFARGIQKQKANRFDQSQPIGNY